MDRLDAHGDSPGWICKHRAAAMGQHQIRVWGGTVVTGGEDGESLEPNLGSFVLDLELLVWHRESPS